jgi:hypothetical protein
LVAIEFWRRQGGNGKIRLKDEEKFIKEIS